VEYASKQFADALKTLENIGEAEIQWSGLPAAVLAHEVRTWWNSQRPVWSQKVNSVYRSVGGGLLWAGRKTVNFFRGPHDADSITTLEEFRTAEHGTAIDYVGKIMEKLETLAQVDNPVVRREIAELTSGEHRAKLLQRADSVLESLPPVDQDFRERLHQHLAAWVADNPKTASWMHIADDIMTAAHPIMTVTLALSGGLLAAPLVYQMASGVAVMTVGETAIQAGSERVSGRAANLFKKIQEDYIMTRSQRFVEAFQKELWQDITARLEAGAAATETDTFKRCRSWHT
jgi:hypothetical protein